MAIPLRGEDFSSSLAVRAEISDKFKGNLYLRSVIFEIMKIKRW